MAVLRIFWIILILLGAGSLPAQDRPPLPINGTELYLSNRLAYSGLSSCRYQMSTDGPRSYRMAYSNSMYRVEEYKEGVLAIIQCFDGETYGGLGMKEMTMQRGTRGPGQVPIPESMLNDCFKLHDVALDHYHSPAFLEKKVSYFVSSTGVEEVLRGQRCLIIESRYRVNWIGRTWCSIEHHGFPLAIEEINPSGKVTSRQDVLDFEIFEVDGRNMLFPLQLETTHPTLIEGPNGTYSVGPTPTKHLFQIDRDSLQINPTIPLSEFQLDPAQAKSILNLETQEITLSNGDVITSDLKRIPAAPAAVPSPSTASSPAAVPSPAIAPAPARSKRSWWVLGNLVFILLVAGYVGYRQWAKK